MPGRFPRSADRAAFAAAAVAMALAAATAIGGAVRWVGGTMPGFVTWDNLVVVALGRPGWTGLQAGVPFRSRVVRVDDMPVTRGTGLRAHVARTPPGTWHRYAFAGRGGATERRLPSMRFGWVDLLAVFGPYALNGLVFCATGLAVFYLNPVAAQSRALLALGAAWGLTLLLALDLFTAGPLQRAYFFAEALAPAAVLHFALRFPERRLPRLPVAALYAAGFGIASAETALFYRDVDALLRLNDGVYLALAASALALIASIGAAAVRARADVAQRRARVVLAGFLAAFALPIAAVLGFFLLGQPVSFSLLAVTGFLFPLSIGYAVARHDLFEADRFVKRTLVYVALTTIVSLAYGGTVLAAERFAAGLALHRHPFFPVFFALAAIAVIGPLRDRVQRGVDRLFYRGRIDYKAVVARTTERLATLLDHDRIAAFVARTLTDDLHFERAHVVATDDPAVAPAARALVRPLSRATVLEARRFAAERPALLATFDRFGAELLVPLRHAGRTIGLLAVGPKGSGHPLSADDVDVLETLASATSVALTTARAVAELRAAEEQVRRTERLAAIGELAAAVAHGIRNPLAGIRLAAQLGLEGAAGADPVRENLTDVLAEVDRLESQVRGVLDFARPFQPALAPVALDALVTEVASGMRAALAAAGTTLDLAIAPGVPAVLGDEPHLRQLLHELLRNAFDACGAGGHIRVALGPAPGDPGRVRLVVADDGPGIPAEQAERVFRLFATTKADGTGVGLAVVRKIIEAHGGSIRLATAAPAGAEFVIDLPQAPGGAPPTGAP